MKKRAGFTVVEILVAASITVLLVGVVLGIVSSVLGGWNRSADKLVRGGAAGLALDYLAQDFQALYAPERPRDAVQGSVWLYAESVVPEGATTSSVALRFFTQNSAAGFGAGGDVLAVAYWIESHDHAGRGVDTMNLYRAAGDAQATFVDFLQADEQRITERWPAVSTQASETNGTLDRAFLLGHVLDFQVSFWWSNPAGELVELAWGDEPITFPFTALVEGGSIAVSRPRIIDLWLRYLPAETADLLRSGEISSAVAAAEAVTLSERVYLR